MFDRYSSMELKISVLINMYRLIIIVFMIICTGEALPKKRVCVIGAGRTGLAAVKLAADQIENFEVIAFERNSDVGGLWIYRDSVNQDEHGLPAHSGIYKHLRILPPKEWLVYPDYPDFECTDNKDAIYHETFLQYMRNYTDRFQLRQYIQFDTLVTKVIPTKGNGDWNTTTWRLEMRNLNTNEDDVTVCDAVMVCNGHYSKPNVAKIPGMETFPGKVLHSRFYRKPEDFADKTVVVLGAGRSGQEIALDLGPHAKNIYLSHRHDPISLSKDYPNVRQVRGVVAANGNEFTLQDNSTIAADTFIFCTGYLYDFPFLDERSGIVIEKDHIRPFYHKSVNVEHPSMTFIGLTIALPYAPSYYDQVNYFLELLRGKQQLPSYEEMLKSSKIPTRQKIVIP